VDVRETMIDVVGQDIMTNDKVTLRMNAVATYRVVDPRRAVSTVDDVKQALYREVQLALRAVIGARELDALLADKDVVAREVEEQVRRRVGELGLELGLELVSVGVRDIILPGEMKDLMNKVTEAKKAAEANLIVRREETAAMRSQVNTAKLLQDNPRRERIGRRDVVLQRGRRRDPVFRRHRSQTPRRCLVAGGGDPRSDGRLVCRVPAEQRSKALGQSDLDLVIRLFDPG